MRHFPTVALAALAIAACNNDQAQQPKMREIKVRSTEQNQLHQLDAINLAIALKRAIYGAGYTCKRVTDAGFVGEYKNVDMWVARCGDRDWAVFAGPDGSAQVRDCKDVVGTEVPECVIKRRPKGDFGGAEKPSAS
jgi:hypothetical protein